MTGKDTINTFKISRKNIRKEIRLFQMSYTSILPAIAMVIVNVKAVT
jgi:hypothetical protein